MYVGESLKRTFERVTGRGKPSTRKARAAVVKRKPRIFTFTDDGVIPNNRLPAVLYPQCVELERTADPAAVFEQLFEANGWNQSWRNGIYNYVHYHSSIHEVLAIARGQARVRLGGDKGEQIDVAAGDVMVLPAGVGHHNLMSSEDFLVVGAYPPAGEYNLCTGKKAEHGKALGSIPKVPPPDSDPVYGADGPLTKLWR